VWLFLSRTFPLLRFFLFFSLFVE
jgi:uncharacterized membrane protein